MEESLVSRVKRVWNAFRNRDPTLNVREYGMSYSYRPDRSRLTRGNERTITASIYNRIAIDVASIDIRHCLVDEEGRFKEEIDSPLNRCLSLEANIDQTGRSIKQDTVMSMFDEGVVALSPIDWETNIDGTMDIETMRVGQIVQWYPEKVKLNMYNEAIGRKEDTIMPKRIVCIIENPLYAIINEPNSTMQRLKRKLSLLDITDEQTASGKLDLIIQLPYSLKSELSKQRAQDRRNDIESQLTGSKYGIAYTDATEKVIQLNRPVENNLMNQVKYLTETLYSQLGITQGILDGSADEQTMLNYHTRTIEPIISAIVDEMNRKFLTKEARDRGERIMFFRDPFKLVPVNAIADIADKFTRNEIMSSNEFRQIVGRKPSSDPKADQLINSNLNHPEEQDAEPTEEIQEEGEIQNG